MNCGRLSVGLWLAIGGCYSGGAVGGSGGDTDSGGTGEASDDSTGGDSSDPADPPVDPPAEVSRAGLRRLSAYEYERTVHALLGDDQLGSGASLPPDLRAPFDNDYTGQIASRTLVEAAETLASEIVARLMDDAARRDGVVGCEPTGVADVACFDSFIADFGRQALRRPLSEDEIAEYRELGLSFAEGETDFYAGVAVILREMLQDIEFLYRVEVGEPVEDRPGVYRLSPFELATRISYLVHATTPSDELLDLAASGKLDSTEEVVMATEAMLADPEARRQMDRFHAMWLGYDELQHSPDLINAMRTETSALLERVIFDEQLPWLELFLAKETFVDDDLATHYGLPLPGSSDPVWIDYSEEGRRGILSHGSFLSVAHDVGETSPVRRGLHVLRRLTCQDVPPPPADVVPIEPVAGECKADQLRAHAQGTCAGCHLLFDGIGFGLEQYDVAGRFRTAEPGNPACTIDGEGELAGVGTFNGPAQLGERLVESGMLDDCAVSHLYQYAIGREVDDGESAVLEELSQGFRDSEHRFDKLVVELVSNEAFFFRRNEGEE